MANPLVFTTTQRGFAITTFLDLYGQSCTLQKSSLADKDCIWLGSPTNLCGESNERMHLTQEHVRALLPALQHFADTGQLPPPGDPAPPLERLRHVKRDETVTVLGDAEVQISDTSYQLGDGESLHKAKILSEGDTLTVYRAEDTGKLWVRFPDEFRDGRFVTFEEPSDG